MIYLICWFSSCLESATQTGILSVNFQLTFTGQNFCRSTKSSNELERNLRYVKILFELFANRYLY